MPHASGICRQRRQKVLVERIALAVEALLLGHFAFEPAALFGGVGEFAKAVGDLDAADVELETLGDARVVRTCRASAACPPGYSSRMVARPMPSFPRCAPPARG